uniref:5'-3' exonuclease domain-containing protein n=1 Tax=Tetradesmus obliquus TaxID=3088 RepID=A0A383V7A3_TETOB|eukprot:jgi/Sobl393_1/11275/SZX60672.1
MLLPRLLWHAASASAARGTAHPCARRGVVTAAVAGQQRLYIVDMLPMIHKAVALAASNAAVINQQYQQQQHQHAGGEQGAAHQVMAALLDLLRRGQEPPTHMAVVVDVPGPTFRQLKYPQYKGKRPPTPPGLHQQLACVLALVDAAGIPILAVPGVEADDVLGSLAARAARDGFDVMLVSPDKDMYQLLQPRVRILRSISGSWAPYSCEDFAAEYGLQPRQERLWVDVKALAGDPADNIPGVKSIGQKTALQLVQQLGSVDSILQSCQAQQQTEQLQQVKLRKQQLQILASAEGAAAAMFAKQLVTIVTDLKHPPVWQPWSNFELRVPPDGGELAVQRAVNMKLTWTAARLRDLFQQWAKQDSQQAAMAQHW